jgi:hypothetical protein
MRDNSVGTISTVTEPQPARPVYRLRIMSIRGDEIRHLRALLKVLLRQHGWRCISVEQEPRS